MSAKRRLFTDDHDHDNDGDERERVESSSSFVPPMATATTAAAAEDGVATSTPQKKKARSSYFSPEAKQAPKAVVTPEKAEEKKDDEEAYVPTYIHKNLNYQCRGQATLSENLEKTFQLVEEHYVIPWDFETNIRQYGPLSGTCFEERVVNAYNMGDLLPRRQETQVLICSTCAITGHKRVDCPELI